MPAADVERRLRPCHCTCHGYVQKYRRDACPLCGHHSTRGHWPYPDAHWMGWEPCDDAACHAHGAAAVLEAARYVVRCWDAVYRCTDEFEPEDMGACGEVKDQLDSAIGRLKGTLTREVPR